MSGQLPIHLYKFRSLWGESRAFTRDIVTKNKLYWSAPSQFNDPFDCAPVLVLTDDKNTKEAYLRSLFEKNADKFPNGIDEKVMSIAMSMPSSEYQKTLEDCQRYIRENYAVCSLSTRCDHVLMWAHYADQHQGICLRFRHSYKDFGFGPAFPVEYSGTRPVIEVATKDLNRLAAQVLLTKADYWRYEDEWRMFDPDEGPGLRSFDPRALDGIIFGAAASDVDVREVSEWAKSHESPIELLKARLDEREFLLQIEPI